MVGLKDIIIFTLMNILNVNMYNISLIDPYGDIIYNLYDTYFILLYFNYNI